MMHHCHTHTHTPCAFSLFPLLCSNCLHAAFSLSHMCTDALSPMHITYSSPTYREGSFFLFHSSYFPSHLCCNMPINDAARAPLPTSCLWQRERSVVGGVHALLCTTSSYLSSPLSVLFSSELAHASSVWTECSYFVQRRAQHVRRCLLEVVLVPVSSYSLSLPASLLPISSSVSVLSGTVRKATYVKVLQSCLGPESSCVSVRLCVHACVCDGDAMLHFRQMSENKVIHWGYCTLGLSCSADPLSHASLLCSRSMALWVLPHTVQRQWDVNTYLKTVFTLVLSFICILYVVFLTTFLSSQSLLTFVPVGLSWMRQKRFNVFAAKWFSWSLDECNSLMRVLKKI